MTESIVSSTNLYTCTKVCAPVNTKKEEEKTPESSTVPPYLLTRMTKEDEPRCVEGLERARIMARQAAIYEITLHVFGDICNALNVHQAYSTGSANVANVGGTIHYTGVISTIYRVGISPDSMSSSSLPLIWHDLRPLTDTELYNQVTHEKPSTSRCWYFYDVSTKASAPARYDD